MSYENIAQPAQPTTPKIKPNLAKEAMQALDLITQRAQKEEDSKLVEALGTIFFVEEVNSNALVDLDTMLTLNNMAREFEEKTLEYPESEELWEARGTALALAGEASKDAGYFDKVRVFYEIPAIPYYVESWSMVVFKSAYSMAKQDIEIANIITRPAHYRIGEIALQDESLDVITRNYFKNENLKMLEGFEELVQKKAEEPGPWSYNMLKSASEELVEYIEGIANDWQFDE